MLRPALLLPGLLLLSACYSYAPVQGAAPERGSRVRLHLTEPRDVRLMNVTGNEVVVVSGELIRMSADTALVSAYSLTSRSGYEFIATGETVRVPRSEIAFIQRRRISPLKSGLLAGAVALGTSLIAAAVESGDGDGGLPGTGGQGQ